jgi:hypothetical protein
MGRQAPNLRTSDYEAALSARGFRTLDKRGSRAAVQARN